jgi:hypothetical protein
VRPEAGASLVWLSLLLLRQTGEEARGIGKKKWLCGFHCGKTPDQRLELCPPPAEVSFFLQMGFGATGHSFSNIIQSNNLHNAYT